mgnify:CR=1 FL=1
MNWLFRHRPEWLGRLAGWVLWDSRALRDVRLGRLAPFLLGLQIGVRGRRVR